MPVQYRFEDGVLQLDLAGAFDLAELREALAAAIASPEFRAPACILGDATKLDPKPAVPSPEVLREVADYLASIVDSFQRDWVLVVSDDHAYGLGRMFSAFSESHGIRLHPYRDAAEARRAARQLAG